MISISPEFRAKLRNEYKNDPVWVRIIQTLDDNLKLDTEDQAILSHTCIPSSRGRVDGKLGLQKSYFLCLPPQPNIETRVMGGQIKGGCKQRQLSMTCDDHLCSPPL